MTVSLKILCVDDNFLMRRGVCDLLLDQGYEVKEASHAKKAMQYLDWPDVVILDIRIPPDNRPGQKKKETMGLELAKIFKENRPEVGVILLSAYDHHGQSVISMLRQGYRGLAYLVKGNIGSDELVNAIWQTWRGHFLLDPEVKMEQQELEDTPAWLQHSLELMSTLTPREEEIVAGIAQGLSGQTVANNLNISLKTVQNRLNHVYQKLELPSDPHSPRKSLLLTRVYLAHQHMQ